MIIKFLHITLLLGLVSSCATRYILPGNRFMTPETQGEALRGQVEIQQGNANRLSVDTSEGTVTNGVVYHDIQRTSYQASNSLFDPFDIYWAHTSSANGIFGAKFQILGGSRVSKSAGHKLAIAAGIGENKHKNQDKTVNFNLRAQENYLIYGYRFTEMFMLYANASYSKYAFDGKIKSTDPALNNALPSYKTGVLAQSAGLEVSFHPFVSKLELTYQQLETEDTSQRNRFIFGYSLGVVW